MSRLGLKLPVLLCLALVLPLAVSAQQPQPASYTFVAEWGVPRDKWGELTAFADKSWRPMLERLVGDGTLTDYGITETLVHEEGGMTHSIWFSAGGFAGIEKARLEALKIPPPPFLAAAKHGDLFLTSTVGKRRGGSGSGYLRVNINAVQPGKTAQWLELWEKYNKPVYDELVANGTLSSYAIQSQYVATADPNTRFVVFVAPSAESVDKAVAATTAANQKRTAEERSMMAGSFQQVLVPGANRSFFARVSSYMMK